MDLSKLAAEFNLGMDIVQKTTALIDEGNTIPFIARYRKEVTGGLSDEILRDFHERLMFLRNLTARQDEVIRLIGEQGKLTDELTAAIRSAVTVTEVDDIYRPYRPKRRTRATIAKERGLEPLADILIMQLANERPITEIAEEYINTELGVHTAEDCLNGAMDIFAEIVSDNADYRKQIRQMTFDGGYLVSTQAKEDDISVYGLYSDFREPISKMVSHRVLAVDRGEREEFLKVSVNAPEDRIIAYLTKETVIRDSDKRPYIELAVQDAYKRLIAPSIEREIRSALTEDAGEQAIHLFSVNLKNLLLQPPVRGTRVLGFDPGFRTGCKLAAVDENGKVLDTGVVYCTLPNHDKDKAKKQICSMIQKNAINLVSIGNGTASRESEMIVAESIKEIPGEVTYCITNEAGASVYSASKLASLEFPEYDVSLRSAVSIARRLQDPLSELVKIDPKSIGVGQYQHDCNQKRLGEALDGVVEDSVNSVGVDVNVASSELLAYVAGINGTVAKNIVSYREETGSFKSRRELLKVPKLGPRAFTQAAGFLKVPGGKNILDNTCVHPESYDIALRLLDLLGYTIEDVRNSGLSDIHARLKMVDIDAFVKDNSTGMPTVRDIVESLLKPGRDPRDELPKPVFHSDVLNMDDLSEGMVLTGTVRNVIDFGAFIDIGVHQDGLCHISEIANKYIKHPTEVLSVGDNVTVKVLGIDTKKGRISLSIKQAQKI